MWGGEERDREGRSRLEGVEKVIRVREDQEGREKRVKSRARSMERKFDESAAAASVRLIRFFTGEERGEDRGGQYTERRVRCWMLREREREIDKRGWEGEDVSTGLGPGDGWIGSDSRGSELEKRRSHGRVPPWDEWQDIRSDGLQRWGRGQVQGHIVLGWIIVWGKVNKPPGDTEMNLARLWIRGESEWLHVSVIKNQVDLCGLEGVVEDEL
jgi:hypothetical protein